MRKYFVFSILVFLISTFLFGCSSKATHSTSYERYLKNKEKIEKASQKGKKNPQQVKEDLKNIFPPAGVCPIDTNKIDPDSDQGKLDMALELCKLSQDLWASGDIDGAIKVLDDAYGLILSIENQENDPTIEQQKDDLRFLISKRILEIHTSRLRTTKGLNTPIPLTLNKYVKREIELFTGKEKKFFIESYKRSGRYRPMIVRKLKKAGLPTELSWLPLIESGFKTRVMSPARALGLWQFIPSTGYKFGLKRNFWIDERMDPEKSTDAAIAYLTELHEIFGDWATVLAAYNCGERNVLKAIDRQKINYLDNFWDLYKRLPRETARYVPRFIATLLIIKNPEKYGMKLPKPYKPIRYETVKVSKQMALKDVALALGIDEKVLVELNPSLRYNVTPESEFILKVPTGYKSILIAKLNSIKQWSPPKQIVHKYKKRRIIKHRVRRGESLTILAKRYHTTVRAIKKLNRLRRSRIRIGEVLKIPIGKTSRIAKHTKYKRKYRTTKKTKRGRKKYVVKRGDTLWKIAKRFRVSITKLKRINRLTSNCLAVGQVLTIPSS